MSKCKPALESKREFQVGKYYRVPVIDCFVHGRRGIYVILGSWHEDAEYIGFKDYHFHLDLRFAPQWIFEQNFIRDHHPSAIAVTSVSVKQLFVMFRRRKMRREWPLFPTTSYMRKPGHARHYLTFPELVHAYRDSELTSSGHCPHKGLDLSDVPRVNGIIVCPLHGLCFDAQTGKAIDPLKCDHLLVDHEPSKICQIRPATQPAAQLTSVNR